MEKVNTESNLKKSNLVSWAIFIFALSIVIISLISVVFPALVSSNDSSINELKELGIITVEIEPFITGVWTGSLIVSNFIIFALTILYFKKKLPESLTKLFNFIFTFEISKKVAFIVIAILLTIYIGFSVNELTTVEYWEDYPPVVQRLESWSPEQASSGFEPHVRYFLLWSSMNLFGYYTIVPFIASISLLVLTYFFTVEIAKKRFAGIVAMVILLQSNLFLTYDSTVAYTNFWILFYLLSLFLIYKAWPLSPVLYLFSIASKALTALFFPMSLYFLYRTSIAKTKKIIIGVAILTIIVVGGFASSSGVNVVGSSTQEEFDSDEFWVGFTSFAYQLRFDGVILIFILPLVVGLFIASRKGITHADSIMLLIGGILFTAPLLTGFTEQTNQPYRFVPLVLFFAVGVGVLLSKKN